MLCIIIIFFIIINTQLKSALKLCVWELCVSTVCVSAFQ